MAEEKKRGFHALEQRIHQMEEDDAKQEQRSTSNEGSSGAPRQEQEQKSAGKAKR